MKKSNWNILLSFIVFAGAASALSAQTLSVDKPAISFFAQAGGAPLTQTLQINTSTGAPTFTTFVNTGWLGVNPLNGTAPSALTVKADPTGLAPSAVPYQGTLSIFGPNNRVDVQVSLYVSNVGVSPGSVAFTYQIGGNTPAAQTLTLSGQNAPFTAAAVVSSGANWLQVSPTSGTVPGTLSVSLNTAALTGLAAGPYTGSINITSGAGAPISVPVTLQVSAAPPVTASPNSVNLYYQIGGSNNAPSQTVTLSTTSGVQAVPFSFLNSVDNNPSGTIWFTESPSSGGTIPPNGNTSVTFSYITSTNLPPGTYTGKATLLTPGGAPAQTDIPVKLVVSTLPLLNPTASSVDFTYQLGTANPTPQNITINSTGGATPLNLAATSTGNWLSVPATATAGTAFPINVNPAGLAVGNQTGTITVTSPSAANSPLQITVNLKVANDAVVVAASGGCSTANLTCPLLFAVQTGQAPAPSQTINVTSSNSTALNYTATANSSECGGNWLAVSGGTTATTPGTFSVAVNPSGISAGKCNGSIVITATNSATQAAAPNSPITIPVTMYVSSSALMVTTPNALTFNASVNGSTPAQQNITVASTSSTDQLTYTVTPNTSSGGNWLLTSGSGTTTPNGSNITVTAVPGILSPGTYTGTVTITATGPGGAAVADSPISIPVVFNVNAGTIAADKTSLTFTQLAGGTAPAAQTVNVTGTPGPIAFTVATATETGGSWLTATTTATSTPGAIQVSANAGTLAAGTYKGSVIITAATPPGATGSPITIPVTLTVNAPQSITATPNTLNFTYTLSGATPANQTVAIASTGASAPFTVSIPAAASWLSVTPTAGTASTTPTNLAFSINPQGLTVGKQTATVTVSSTAALSPATITVNLTVNAAAVPGFTSITNAASYAPGAVSPGENVTLFGTNIGPDTLTGAQLTPSGMLATTVADTQVTFDNVPAPIIYVSSKQTSVMVPFEVTGRPTTQVRVTYKGVTSDPVTYNVTTAVPGIYTQNAQGNGPGSILNQDLTVNGPTNPAAKNSVVAVYMTGEGATQPPSTTGAVAGSSGNPLNKTPLAVTATVGGQPATVEYYSEAPGIVYGVMQVNVRIPANTPSGAQPIVITVGSNSTQPNVTVSVQ